jgi:hypothetical protein
MKIYLVIGLAITALAVAGIYTVYSLMTSAWEIDLTRQVELEMLHCRRHEKDFLAQRDTTYISKHAATYSKAAVGAKRIETAVADISILRHMKNYRLAFHDIAQAMSEVGLTENEGLRG